MNPQQKNINIIHSCEEHFFELLKLRLGEQGISIEDSMSLSEILQLYSKQLDSLRQHIKPLLKWDKVKDECYSLSNKMNGSGKRDEYLQSLIEKVAFEGQVLRLTIHDE